MINITDLARNVIVQLQWVNSSNIHTLFVTQKEGILTNLVTDAPVDVTQLPETLTHSLPAIPLDFNVTELYTTNSPDYRLLYQQSVIDFCNEEPTAVIGVDVHREMQVIIRTMKEFNYKIPPPADLLSTSDIHARAFIRHYQLFLDIASTRPQFDIIQLSITDILEAHFHAKLLPLVKEKWTTFLLATRDSKIQNLMETVLPVSVDSVTAKFHQLQRDAAITRLKSLQLELDIFDTVVDVLTYWPFDNFQKINGVTLFRCKEKPIVHRVLKQFYGVQIITPNLLQHPEILEQVRRLKLNQLQLSANAIIENLTKELPTAAPTDVTEIKYLIDMIQSSLGPAVEELKTQPDLLSTLQYWPLFLYPPPGWVIPHD